MKCLLIQIREDEKVRLEELNRFACYSELSVTDFAILNVFSTPSFSPQMVNDYDLVMVGGASEASVLETEQYPFVTEIQQLLQVCIEVNKPVFCSCFGFQLAVLALGGTIIRDRLNYEMGTIPIQLTQAAKIDPVMKMAKEGFLAVSVHQEKAVTLPECCEQLAYTTECVHAFKVKEKPFWAFQFHPEVDKHTLVERLTVYKAHYTNDDAHLQEVIDSAEETPESNQLLAHFVRYVRSIIL